MNENKLKLRFAPSPTGYLHIGGARTCLFSWLYARKLNAKFILRIEDTDCQRSSKEYLEEILESIQWLGMDWDEIYYQSERFNLYLEYAQKLIEQGKAYKKDGAVFFKYDFNLIEIDDLIRGKIEFKELPKAEEVIIKSDGSPTYNFCCVIDDALMEINCVVRGEDHISNTPKQILIYQGLGFNVPKFAHVPLILSPDGGRLSKRFGATSIREYRQLGYLKEAIVNYLLLLGWSPGGDKEIISLSEAKELFDLKDVNKTGAAFSLDRFNWLNGNYIRAKEIKELTALVKEQAKEKVPANVSEEQLEKVVVLFQPRAVTLQEIVDKFYYFFTDQFSYADDAKNVLEKNVSEQIMLLIKQFSSLDNFSHQVVEEKFRQVCDQLGVKVRDLVHPVRVALSGIKIGPGLFEMIEVLGKEEVIKRLNRLIDYWHGKEI